MRNARAGKNERDGGSGTVPGNNVRMIAFTGEILGTAWLRWCVEEQCSKPNTFAVALRAATRRVYSRPARYAHAFGRDRFSVLCRLSMSLLNCSFARRSGSSRRCNVTSRADVTGSPLNQSRGNLAPASQRSRIGVSVKSLLFVARVSPPFHGWNQIVSALQLVLHHAPAPYRFLLPDELVTSGRRAGAPTQSPRRTASLRVIVSPLVDYKSRWSGTELDTAGGTIRRSRAAARSSATGIRKPPPPPPNRRLNVRRIRRQTRRQTATPLDQPDHPPFPAVERPASPRRRLLNGISTTMRGDERGGTAALR
jgi:hypothetical protein